MDLFVTWEGHTGQGVKYKVEYRPYPGGGPWTLFSDSVLTNYVNIPDLAEGFYEVRVTTDCPDVDSSSVIQIGGKAPCPIIKFVSYTIVEENETQQVLRVFFSDNTGTVRLVVTNLNSGTTVQSQLIIVDTVDNLNIVLPKIAGQTTVYNVTLSNICDGVIQSAVSMGDYSVVGPPAIITTSFKFLQNFQSGNNCAPYSSGLANSGTRATFSEPLPQAVTIVFDSCYRCTFNPNILCDSTSFSNQRYLKITIPAGTTTWAASHYRTCDVFPNTQSVCIVRVEPAILNNGKSLSFSDASNCTSFNPSLPVFDLNNIIPYPPCINGST